MSRASAMPHWLRNLGITLLVLAAVAGAAFRFVDIVVTESYSSEWTAASSRAAAAEGRLRARPAVATADVLVEGQRMRVADLWIEQAYHVEHPYFLWRRVVLDPRYRILMRLESTGTAAVRGSPSFAAGWPTYNDSGRFTSRANGLWLGTIAPPFPDTVRIAFPHRRREGR